MDRLSSYLVTYISNSGSTSEVAERIGERIRNTGNRVTVLPVNAAKDLEQYSHVVVGAPMIIGWHKKALRFLKRNSSVLSGKQLALFMMAMEVSESGSGADRRVTVDPNIAKSVDNPQKLTFTEKHTTVAHYTEPVLHSKNGVSPTHVAIFGGKLDYTKLRFPQNLFVMLVIGAKPGDRRNWDLIDTWTDTLTVKAEEDR